MINDEELNREIRYNTTAPLYMQHIKKFHKGKKRLSPKDKEALRPAKNAIRKHFLENVTPEILEEMKKYWYDETFEEVKKYQDNSASPGIPYITEGTHAKRDSHEKAKIRAARFVKNGDMESNSHYWATSHRGKMCKQGKKGGRVVMFANHDVILALNRVSIGLNKLMNSMAHKQFPV